MWLYIKVPDPSRKTTHLQTCKGQCFTHETNTPAGLTMIDMSPI